MFSLKGEFVEERCEEDCKTTVCEEKSIDLMRIFETFGNWKEELVWET